MTTQTFETGTIRQVHRHLVSNGHHVSEYAIRRWVKLRSEERRVGKECL